MDGQSDLSFTPGSRVPTWRSCRFMMAYVGIVGFLFVYALRIDISLAIVCMVKPPQHALQDTSLNSTLVATIGTTPSTASPTVASDEEQCEDLSAPSRHNYTEGDNVPEFDWARPLQGYILSSFFYGYIATQIPGGWLADRFGGKHVFAAGMLLTAGSTLLVPVCARVHFGLVIFMRVLAGLGSGVVFPAMHSLWSKWAPPFERTKLVTFSYAGTMLGNIFAFFLSGLLCEYGFDNGWPSIFYLFGGACIIWLVFWMALVFNSPADHPRISKEEKAYIEKGTGSHVQKKVLKVPWIKFVTSGPLWAIVLAHICSNWGNYTILTSLPSYMKDVLKFDMKENGFMSALPYSGMFVATMIAGPTVDLIRSKGYSTTTVRKVVQSVAFFIPCAFLIATGFLDCTQRYVAVAFLVIAVTSTAMSRCGYLVNHIDIAPRYAGVLFGITNTFATVPGMIAPIAVGQVTQQGSRAEWQMVFYICGGFYAFGGILYLVMGSGVEKNGQRMTLEKNRQCGHVAQEGL